MLRRRRAANVVINDNGEPVIKHGLRHQPWASAQASETALLERIPERNTPGHEGQRGAPDHSDLPRGNTLADSRQLPRCQAGPTAMNYVATADIYVVDQTAPGASARGWGLQTGCRNTRQFAGA